MNLFVVVTLWVVMLNSVSTSSGVRDQGAICIVKAGQDIEFLQSVNFGETQTSTLVIAKVINGPTDGKGTSCPDGTIFLTNSLDIDSNRWRRRLR